MTSMQALTPEQIEEAQRKERRIQWERRFQSVTLMLVASAVIWGIQTLVNVDKGQAVTNVRLSTIEIQVSGAYSANDARRDTTDMGTRLDTISTHVDAIDMRVRALEVGPPRQGARQ